MKNLICIICLFAALPVFSQQEKGDKQMSLSASFKSNSTEGAPTTSSFNFQYSASKFYTKHLEIGISYIGSFSTSLSYNGLSPFLNFNILSKNGRFVFYMGAQYLLNSTSIDAGGSKTATTSGGVGGKLGIRSYMSDNIFMFIGPNYTAFANSQSQFDMTAGIGVLFKKTKKTQ
jgi:hypothetical protein